MRNISSKQQLILRFLREFLQEKGYPPTIRDIVKGCHISSTSVVDYHLNILEKQGYIRRDPEVSRGIELMGRDYRQARMVTVPIIGSIAAGEPIPVPTADTWDEAASAETIELPPDLAQGKAKVYALRVRGNSMMDALIGDGDLVLMEQVSTADNGDTVAVWLKAEREATLKKFYREQGRIRLQPANSQMQPFYTDPNNVEIQGKILCVIRRLE